MGGGFSSGKSDSESEQFPGFTVLDPRIQEPAMKGMEWFEKYFGQAGPRYEGEFIPPLTPDMMNLVGKAGDFPYGESYGAGEELSRTLSGDYLRDIETSPFLTEESPYLQENIDAALRDLETQWTDVTEPAVRGAAKSAGALYSSEMPNQMARAAEDYSTLASDLTSGMREEDYGARRKMYEELYGGERARMTEGVGMAPELASLPLAQMGAAYPLVSKPWEAEAGRAAMTYQDYLKSQDERWKLMQQMSNLLAAILGGSQAGWSESSAEQFAMGGGAGYTG